MSKDDNKPKPSEKGKIEIPNNIPNQRPLHEDRNYSEKSEQYDIGESKLPDFEFTPKPPSTPKDKSDSAD